MNAEQIAGILLSENLQRVDLSPIEEAGTFERLLRTRSIEDLAAYLNRSANYIRRRLQLGRLETSVRDKLLSGAIRLSIVEQLACLPPVQQKSLLSMMEEQALNDVQLSNLLILQNNRKLQTAPFETSDCVKCLHNSAGQPELFAGGTSGLGLCLNDTCWREKEGEKAKFLVIEEMGPRAVLTEKLKIGLKDLPADIDPTLSIIHHKAELGSSHLVDCQSCKFLVVFISSVGFLLKQKICSRQTCYQERASSFRAEQAKKEAPVSPVSGQESQTSQRSSGISSKEAQNRRSQKKQSTGENDPLQCPATGQGI